MHIGVAQKCVLNKQSDHSTYYKDLVVLLVGTDEQSSEVNGVPSMLVCICTILY